MFLGSYVSYIKMVNVMKGVLIECDPAMKQFLLHLDEKVSLFPIADNRVYTEKFQRFKI